MRDFKSGGARHAGERRSGGGWRSFDKGRPNRFEGRDRGPVTMYQATCAQCGSPCEVPFRPVEGRPVYCAACFDKKRGDGNERAGSRLPRQSFGGHFHNRRPDDGARESFSHDDDVQRQIAILNEKIDRLTKMVEAAAAQGLAAKPVVAEEKVRETIRAAIGASAIAADVSSPETPSDDLSSDNTTTHLNGTGGKKKKKKVSKK